MGRGEVELHALRVFFIVADAAGRPVPQSAIRERTGLSEAATSRNVALLSTGATFTTPGPGLIESYEDPEYRRRKLVRLTAKGKTFMAALSSIGSKG